MWELYILIILIPFIIKFLIEEYKLKVLRLKIEKMEKLEKYDKRKNEINSLQSKFKKAENQRYNNFELKMKLKLING